MNYRDIPAPPAPDERMRALRRSRATHVLVGVMFAALLGRLWYLQIARGEALREASEHNRIRIERKPAPRGDLKDRNGILLAGTRPKFVVSVNPTQFRADGPEGRRLSECLNMPLEELKKLAKPAGPNYKRARIAVDVSRKTLARLMEMRPWLPGVSVDLEELRYYPRQKLASHLMGYIGPVTQSQMEADPGVYSPEARAGQVGIEKVYEKHLRGVDGGLQLEVDASGRRRSVIGMRMPQRGADITLTIDAPTQKAAEDALTGKVGSAVALNPQTGEVLALASRPAFDPNLFARGISNDEWRSIMADKNLPLLNRAVQSKYPPGSTFKLITALAGLNAAVINERSGARCTGAVYLGSARFRCWKRHGYVDFKEAVAQSCDTFFYRVGRLTGPDAIATMATRFGLGRKTGIDLTGEVMGRVPTTIWKKKNFKRDPKWHPGETLNLSIGQGYLQTTSLQIALMTGAVAMHGKVYQPRLVKSINHGKRTETLKPVLLHKVDLPDKHYDLLARSLKQTVDDGTGRQARLPGIAVGGKTGSAQNPHGVAHAWFTCVAPLDNPKIAVAVMVEHGEHGATSAAPIARKIMQAYFRLRESSAADAAYGD